LKMFIAHAPTYLERGDIYERMQLAVKAECWPSWQERSRKGCHAGPTGQGRVSTSYNTERGGGGSAQGPVLCVS
jgi:hypothetical protein